MRANEIYALDELNDQVTFEDCMVRKVDLARKLTGNYQMDGFFCITTIQREDLREVGFDISHVTDEQMSRLAAEMAANYCRQLFWDNLETVALEMGIPRLMKVNKSY
jgi:hypothetical protein